VGWIPLKMRTAAQCRVAAGPEYAERQIMSSKPVVASLALLLSLLLASSADAANRYIDDSGSDAGANDCLQPATPCQTINYALATGSGSDAYLVGGGTYLEQVTIGATASLRRSDFKPPATSGAAVVDGGAGVGITSTTTGEIRGLTVRGDQHGIVVNGGSATIAHDVFDDPQVTFGRVNINSPASATVDSSSFLGVAGLNTDLGLYGHTHGAVTVANSRFTHFGWAVLNDTPNSLTIRDNLMTVHGRPPNNPGYGVDLNGPGIILRNRITGESPGPTHGIGLNNGDSTLHANRVRGMTYSGVSVADPGHLVTMDSDVVTGNGDAGIDVPFASTGLRLINETVVENNGPAEVTTVESVSIDSSIIGAGGVSAANGCTITFSRGPTTSGNSCQRFQTAVNPRFVSATDFHLLPSSTLIDAGNPMAPTVGARDADGRPRALDGNRDCIVRRDMGAFEFRAKPCVRPHCTLAPKSSQVRPSGKKKGRGVIRLRAKCGQKVSARLAGTVKVKRPGAKATSGALGPVTAKLKRGVARTLRLKLPKAALQALANGASESARFTLTARNAPGATGIAKARIKHLTAKP
jgi:hypothetical protein